VLSIVLNNVLNTTEKSNILDMYTEPYDDLIYDDHIMYTDSTLIYTDSISAHVVYNDYDNTDLNVDYCLPQCADVTNPADVVGT
jgi:hypothetical protein